jgi:hypothetical protein
VRGNNKHDVAIGKCPCGATYWDGMNSNGFRWQHCDDHAADCPYGPVVNKVGAMDGPRP